MCLDLEISVQMSWLRGTSVNQSELPMASELSWGPALFSPSLYLPFPKVFLSFSSSLFLYETSSSLPANKESKETIFLHGITFNEERRFILKALMF